VYDPEILHRAGLIGLPATSATKLLHRADIGMPVVSVEPNGRLIAVAVCRQTSREKIGIVVWRCRGAPEWAGDDVPLVDAAAGIVWLLMDHVAGPREVFRSSPTALVTALLNQRTFIAEACRHFARLDRDDLPGTLMLVEADHLESVGKLLGPDGRDLVLRRAAILLRCAVRPTDLVARTGETEFAIWLSGADYMIAAERAENLCLEAPSRTVGPDNAPQSKITFSIGIATRHAGERFSDLANRATEAMRQVKREGGGYWRVSLGNPA
jgi:diguanylate cyclase (GGDEF)-like protein